MASLIAGYEYDIFISYRHNDNLPSYDYGRQGKSGWVTGFVKNLQEELAATIKDPISIYLDSNPVGGLLETHNVDKSLEGKLKCLILFLLSLKRIVILEVLPGSMSFARSTKWQRKISLEEI